MVVPENGLCLSPFIVTIRNRWLFQNMVSVYCDMETIKYGLGVTINGDHKKLSKICFAVAQFQGHFYYINLGESYRNWHSVQKLSYYKGYEACYQLPTL